MITWNFPHHLRKAIWVLSLVLAPCLTASPACSAVAYYRLDNVVLQEGNALMTGVFSWSYAPGDFQNGIGQFLTLDIPFTAHDQTDLTIVFDITKSIEFTLPGNFHDDGVDITLFLLQPLTPTTGADLDLTRSVYDIGGNGFHAGSFVSGSIQPTQAAAIDGRTVAGLSAPVLESYPNPFNPLLNISFVLQKDTRVRIGVYDMAGRLVRPLATPDVATAGRFTTTWDGRDAFGRAAASGPYLIRLDTATGTSVRKVLLAK